MISFASPDDYRAHVGDLGLWWPHAEGVLRRHGLTPEGAAKAATGGSYPTILVGGLVVKFYGHEGRWRRAHATEQHAYEVLAADRELAAPRLLASGTWQGWPYLVITRVPGTTWADAAMEPAELRSAAADLGAHIARLHALPPGEHIERFTDWPPLDYDAACAQSALPTRFVTQAASFVAEIAPDDAVFSNGDLFEGNILVENGHVTGLIDWGDTLVIDRHNELAKIHLSTFACDKTLLRAFLEGADWQAGEDFPRRAMAMALVRQAVGITQHGQGFDNFFLLPKLFPLDDIATLDELAEVVFGV